MPNRHAGHAGHAGQFEVDTENQSINHSEGEGEVDLCMNSEEESERSGR